MARLYFISQTEYFNLNYRVTIKYKHVADAIERSFSKDCSITEDNVSIQGKNGNLFTRSVGYFAAFKNAIQQLENAPMIPGDQSREVNAKIAKLSVEGHILSSRTAFIGVEKIDSNKPKPELNETSEVFIIHSLYYAPCIYSDIMSGTGTISDDIIYDFFQKMKIDSTDNHVGASEIEIPDIGSNIAGLQNRTQYHTVDFMQPIPSNIFSASPNAGMVSPNQMGCSLMQMPINLTNSKFEFCLPSRNFVNDRLSRK